MLKWRFPNLKDEDFEFEEGQKETMLNQLAARIKKSRSELDAIFLEMQLF